MSEWSSRIGASQKAPILAQIENQGLRYWDSIRGDVCEPDSISY